jgi:hypothetical protein
VAEKMSIEKRTFIGETSTAVGDGYAGFRVGRTYELQVEHRSDGTVPSCSTTTSM